MASDLDTECANESERAEEKEDLLQGWILTKCQRDFIESTWSLDELPESPNKKRG